VRELDQGVSFAEGQAGRLPYFPGGIEPWNEFGEHKG